MFRTISIFFNFYLVLVAFNAFSQEIDLSLINEVAPNQIQEIKEMIGDQQAPSLVDENEPKKESLKENEALKNPQEDGRKFGYNFISSSPTSIIATGDLPLPNDYKISLGDTFVVILSGAKEGIFDLKVKLDGTIFFPELGSISVYGESFQEVKVKLRNLINQSYIGVEIDLSLKNLSAKKITVVGAVNTPGTYLVNPFTTISNSLAYSGGINQIGSLREIRLIRPNGDLFTFDLYDLLIKGDRSNDLTIESGDVIVIGPANKFVEISGEVKRPGIYEILPGEDLSDLLDFSLGFSGGANNSKITLNKIDTDSASVIQIVTDKLNHNLKNILSVSVFPYKNDNFSEIFVSGSVKEPGFYNLKEFNTLEKLINSLEFVDVYPWLAVLEQFDDENYIKSSILFNLNDPKTFRSVKLLPNSKIFFADARLRDFTVNGTTRNLINDYQLTINHKQGSFSLPVYGNYSVKSFVDLLGLDMSDVDSEATYISPLESVVIIDSYLNMRFDAKKYNTISFRSPINDLIRVRISGAVDYPGTYTLESDSTLEDLYKLVGNLKGEAFESGIILTRDSIRDRQRDSIARQRENLREALILYAQEGTDVGSISSIMNLSESIEPENLGRIAGDFSPGSMSSINTTLMEGDTVFVPYNPNVINVLGEVLNPIAFEYSERLNVKTAIENAGGYQDYADKGNVYVIKANGLIERANRNIFTKNINLGPGDTIIVPRKIIFNNPALNTLIPITKILSDMAFTAAALEGLSN